MLYLKTRISNAGDFFFSSVIINRINEIIPKTNNPSVIIEVQPHFEPSLKAINNDMLNVTTVVRPIKSKECEVEGWS
ncbi:hypothetical protein rsdtw13_14970 [Clostridium sp. TW13]|uniref:Uncharacterized protein n=1 Tax=Inconstantimicrobium mannanitabidum TaxID=1604901 RepID=A0ACB5RAL2_9CLOT|nr:hypothetical protein rsdtw13_14970 [Clostridium sp. TW13]